MASPLTELLKPPLAVRDHSWAPHFLLEHYKASEQAIKNDLKTTQNGKEAYSVLLHLLDLLKRRLRSGLIAMTNACMEKRFGRPDLSFTNNSRHLELEAQSL